MDQDQDRSIEGTELAGRYLIQEPLGYGGMGRVYCATDQQLHRRVAVKLLREELTTAHDKERFIREARSAASLEHPHACRLYELGEHDGQLFLVMELLEGEPLSARLKGGPMPVESALEVVLELMGAVSALHDVGLIHRDLKPANVFLTAQGVKLLDFGLARHTRPEAAVTTPSLTLAGRIAGTVRYMAPEQVTGDRVDERTDVFAIGVTLYEMLTGRIPFTAETNLDWFQAVLHDDPQPLGPPELAALEPFMRRALQRRPGDRFESVAEMAAALRALSASDAPAAPTPFAVGDTQTVVVTPFRNLQDDPDISFLQHAVPEALTAGMAGRNGWRVLSNREAMRFDESADTVTIGRQLGADLLVTGTVLRAGDQVRVTTQLVNAVDGTVRWSETTQHAFVDPLTLQDDICRQILDRLEAGQADENAATDAITTAPSP